MKYEILENEKESFIGPGTAGLAQRISSVYGNSENLFEGLYALKHNAIMTCDINQF